MNEQAGDLADIATEINAAHDAYEQGVRTSYATAVRIGKLLIEVKDRLGARGRFTRWCEENLRFKLRQAQKYKRLAEHHQESSEHGSIKDGLAAIGVEESLEALAETMLGVEDDEVDRIASREEQDLAREADREKREADQDDQEKLKRKLKTLANIARYLRERGLERMAELIEQALEEDRTAEEAVGELAAA